MSKDAFGTYVITFFCGCILVLATLIFTNRTWADGYRDGVKDQLHGRATITITPDTTIALP